jgi:hypothetical protein
MPPVRYLRGSPLESSVNRGKLLSKYATGPILNLQKSSIVIVFTHGSGHTWDEANYVWEGRKRWKLLTRLVRSTSKERTDMWGARGLSEFLSMEEKSVGFEMEKKLNLARPQECETS